MELSWVGEHNTEKFGSKPANEKSHRPRIFNFWTYAPDYLLDRTVAIFGSHLDYTRAHRVSDKSCSKNNEWKNNQLIRVTHKEQRIEFDKFVNFI